MGSKRSGRRGPKVKPSPDQSSFGILLTSYLSKHKISIMDLARKTGIADRQIRSWIAGEYFPTMPSIIMMAEVIAILEVCFLDTIVLEIAQTHDNFVMAKRRETRRHNLEATKGMGV